MTKRKMKKLKMKDVLEYMLMMSFVEVEFFQKLIDKWDDPKDIVQRAAVLLRDTHKMYGGLLGVIYHDMVKR